MSLDLRRASAIEIAKAVSSGSIQAVEVTKFALKRIADSASTINAFTRVTERRALEESAAVDRKIADGKDPGPLCGVPYGVKNLFDLEGETTVAGSKINRDYPPASRDATAVARLKSAGAICLGALNMGEYAYDFITSNPHDGATCNPHDQTRSAGGSSGGSGAAVAAGLVALALGSDTNGSIRVPASFCGVWGLRPTYGGLSRGGSFAFVDSLDTIGPFAREVADLAVAFDVIAGRDERDMACRSKLAGSLAEAMDIPIEAIRLAQLGGYFATGCEDEVHEAVDTVCRALGADRVIELPETELARTAAYIITASESAARHLERLRSRADDFDPVIRDRLIAGALIPAAWPVKAHRFRAWWKLQLAKVFQSVDVLIAPATPIRAPRLGQETFLFKGGELPLRPNIGLFTQPLSLVGLPVVAAPVPVPGGLPCAVQLIAAPWNEARLLAVASELSRRSVCQAPWPVQDSQLASLTP